MAEEPKSKDTSGITDDSINRIILSVNNLSEGFGRIYERLNYPGFVSVFGAILVFVPLFLGKLPLLGLSTEEQKVYVIIGALFIVIGASWITIQNILIYKLQRAKQEVACRMLGIKVAAMGETQRAALQTMGETKTLELPDSPFKNK
jgi:hypothetical protein